MAYEYREAGQQGSGSPPWPCPRTVGSIRLGTTCHDSQTNRSAPRDTAHDQIVAQLGFQEVSPAVRGVPLSGVPPDK
jgi:hypothetical protein